MEDKIRNKVRKAYDGIVLEEGLKRRAKEKILQRAQADGRRKIIYGVAAAAAVVLLIAGNFMLIRFHAEHEEKIPATEAQPTDEQQETVIDVSIRELSEIRTLEELEEMTFSPNCLVRELENKFYVAVLCYDENGEPCPRKGDNTAGIEYAYFLFDESGAKLKEWQDTFDIENNGYQSIGAVYINDDWYEVRDSKKDGVEHYYEIFNITSPEKSNYARCPEDEETVALIADGTYYFVTYAQDGGGYIKVEGGDDEYYGQMYDLSNVNSRQDLEKLMTQPGVYSVQLSDDIYFAAMAYRQNWRCSPDGQPDRFDFGCYRTEGNEIAAYGLSVRKAESSILEYIGLSGYDGTFYLIGKEKDTEKYRISILLENWEEQLYCDEGICPEVYSNAAFFAGLVREGDRLYWQLGEDIRRNADYSSKSYCEAHGWAEQCTSRMTVRDIYVAKNWIGGSTAVFTDLKHFFKENVRTEYVTGDLDGGGSEKDAYQTDYYFECMGLRVSAEAGSDEIISATVFADHDYVTEDVWIGMDMEKVKQKMDMAEEAFFKQDADMYASVERDGYLYEFRFTEEPIGSNLPPYASYPAPDYILSYAKVSNAAKILKSPVKSLGEAMFGDSHSLEEGKVMY